MPSDSQPFFWTPFFFSQLTLFSQSLPPVSLVTGNEVTKADLSLPKEQIITSLQDGRLNLNDSLSIEDVQLSHGLLSLHNLNALSTLDFEFDDALEDVHILNAVANSINEWKLRKNAKNASSNGVNKKRVKRYEYSVESFHVETIRLKIIWLKTIQLKEFGRKRI